MRAVSKERGPQHREESVQEELKLEFPFTHATGLHSPTSTVVEFVPLRTQPTGRASFLDLGLVEHESSDFSEKRKQTNM